MSAVGTAGPVGTAGTTGPQNLGGAQVPTATPVTTRSIGGRAMKRRRSRFAPSNWRVRWRLAAVIAIPTIAAAVLGALQISGDASNYNAFGRVQTLVKLNAAVVTLTQNLEDERDWTAGYVASQRTVYFSQVTQAQEVTNASVKAVQADAQPVINGSGFQPNTVQDLQGLLAALSDLANVRTVAIHSLDPADKVLSIYTSNIIDSANTFSGAVGNGANDAPLQSNLATLATLLRGENQMSVQRGLLFAALNNELPGPTSASPPTADPVLTAQDLGSLNQAIAQETAEFSDFKASTSEAEGGLFDNTTTSTQRDAALQEEQQAISAESTPNTPLSHAGLNATDWWANMSAEINQTR